MTESNELYKNIYAEIAINLNPILGKYVHDEDKSYQAGLVLLMFSMKMHMFAGIEKQDFNVFLDNIKETFDNVYEDFKKVDLDLKD